MGQRLLGQNCAIQLTDGGPQDGPPVYGTAVNAKGLAKSIKLNRGGSTDSFPALGDVDDIVQFKRRTTSVDIEVFNESGEPLMLEDMRGRYIKVGYKLLQTQTTFTFYEGVCTKHDIDMPDGPQIESFTIMCKANGAID